MLRLILISYHTLAFTFLFLSTINLSFQAFEDYVTDPVMDQWNGGNLPPLNWHFDPGPCRKPEAQDCRGEPYNKCFRYWLPCKWWRKGPTPYYECCWSQGPKKHVECRHPNRELLGEFGGADHYTYCLPIIDLVIGREPGSRNRNNSSKSNPHSKLIDSLDEIMRSMKIDPKGAGGTTPKEKPSSSSSKKKCIKNNHHS